MPQQCLGEVKLHTEREGNDGREWRVWNRLVHRRRRPVGYAMALHVVPGTAVVPVHDVSSQRSDLGGELASQANANGGWPGGGEGVAMAAVGSTWPWQSSSSPAKDALGRQAMQNHLFGDTDEMMQVQGRAYSRRV
jgi:hypothetical protein